MDNFQPETRSGSSSHGFGFQSSIQLDYFVSPYHNYRHASSYKPFASKTPLTRTSLLCLQIAISLLNWSYSSTELDCIVLTYCDNLTIEWSHLIFCYFLSLTIKMDNEGKFRVQWKRCIILILIFSFFGCINFKFEFISIKFYWIFQRLKYFIFSFLR